MSGDSIMNAARRILMESAGATSTKAQDGLNWSRPQSLGDPTYRPTLAASKALREQEDRYIAAGYIRKNFGGTIGEMWVLPTEDEARRIAEEKRLRSQQRTQKALDERVMNRPTSYTTEDDAVLEACRKHARVTGVRQWVARMQGLEEEYDEVYGTQYARNRKSLEPHLSGAGANQDIDRQPYGDGSEDESDPTKYENEAKLAIDSRAGYRRNLGGGYENPGQNAGKYTADNSYQTAKALGDYLNSAFGWDGGVEEWDSRYNNLNKWEPVRLLTPDDLTQSIKQASDANDAEELNRKAFGKGKAQAGRGSDRRRQMAQGGLSGQDYGDTGYDEDGYPIGSKSPYQRNAF